VIDKTNFFCHTADDNLHLWAQPIAAFYRKYPAGHRKQIAPMPFKIVVIFGLIKISWGTTVVFLFLAGS